MTATQGTQNAFDGENEEKTTCRNSWLAALTHRPLALHPIYILEDLLLAFTQRDSSSPAFALSKTKESLGHEENFATSGPPLCMRASGYSPQCSLDDSKSDTIGTLPLSSTDVPSTTCTTPIQDEHEHERQVDLILRAADFIFRSYGQSFQTLLESALAVLDSTPSYTGHNGVPVVAVRRLIADMSGRVAYIVRAGSASSSPHKAGRHALARSRFAGTCDMSSSSPQPIVTSEVREYLCLLGECRHVDGDIITIPAGQRMFYCTCRSFYENLKRHTSTPTSTEMTRSGRGNAVVCKHLLAAKLAPHLRHGIIEEAVSEETFSALFVQASMP